MTHPVEGSPDAPRSGAPAVPDPEGCWGSLAGISESGGDGEMRVQINWMVPPIGRGWWLMMVNDG